VTQTFTDLQSYNLRVKTPEDRRALAVAAALTLIQAKASNTPSDCNVLTDEMNNLSTYADQIQQALQAS
jgi:hypothetical protein